MKCSLYMTAALLPLVVSAAGTSMRSPVSGYVFDAEKGIIRPLNGLPGAALLGGAMEAPEALAKVFFGPRQATAVAVSRPGTSYHVRLDGSNATFTALPDLQMNPDLVAFTPDGKSAVVYEAATRRYRLLTGLSDAPAAGESAALPELPGEITALALNPAAVTLAAAVRTGDAAAVYAINLEMAETSFVSDALSVETLSFSDSGSLLFADRGSDRVLTAASSAAGWQVSVVADGRDGLAGPAGAEFSGGAVVILSGSEIVLRQAGVLTRIALPVKALRLAPMAAPGLLYLDAKDELLGAAPLHLLDLSGEARVVFVPAGGAQ